MRSRPERSQRVGQGRDVASDPHQLGERAAGPPSALRRSQHPAPGACQWRGALICPRFSRTPEAGSGKRVGCGGTRCSSGPSGTWLPRRFPSLARLCQPGTQLDVAAHRWPQRRLAARSSLRIGATSSDSGPLSPRVARRGSERPFRARSRPLPAPSRSSSCPGDFVVGERWGDLSRLARGPLAPGDARCSTSCAPSPRPA